MKTRQGVSNIYSIEMICIAIVFLFIDPSHIGGLLTTSCTSPFLLFNTLLCGVLNMLETVPVMEGY